MLLAALTAATLLVAPVGLSIPTAYARPRPAVQVIPTDAEVALGQCDMWNRAVQGDLAKAGRATTPQARAQHIQKAKEDQNLAMNDGCAIIGV